MRSRQRLGLGQSALAHDLPGAIHIGNQPGLSTPIRDPSRISKRGAGQHVLPGEGQVNKLKYIKRSMYGREKFELLRQRFLQAA